MFTHIIKVSITIQRGANGTNGTVKLIDLEQTDKTMAKKGKDKQIYNRTFDIT